MPEQPPLPAGSAASSGAGEASRTRVADLAPGDRVRGTYLLTRCDLRTTRAGDPYLDLELSDATGRVAGRMWDHAESVVREVGAGDHVHVEGAVETWKSAPQVKVERMEPAREGDYDPADFLPSSSRDPAAMYEELLDEVAAVGNEHLRRLLLNVFNDPEVAERFRRAPGGVRLHHAYLGGLLEHTLSVVRLAGRVADHYPALDRDLLLAGAFLHDLGKIWELTWETAFEYSEEGRLVGHLMLETAWLSKAMDRVEGFPGPLRNHLLHLLASHHGKQEHGAPLEPHTPEALALHYVDDLDSKMAAIETTIAEARSTGSTTAWSRSLGRRVFAGRWDEVDD